MKKLLSSIALFSVLISCTSKQDTGKSAVEPSQWWSDATIYEINTRQFSPQGTFSEVEKQLPRLKDMGVDILWFMPIQPIGQLNRKGSLGSYYSIADYTAVNPEFGTMDDFKKLVDKAHQLDMKVILDWVANHTSWDAKWINNDGWYSLDSTGKKYSPYDWSDVVELNYDNSAMRNEMINEMKYWIVNAGIDGFRADMAHEVPTSFWNAASDSLKALKPDIFMLAESENPDLMNKAFDMNYAWELHHLMNALAKSEVKADSLWRFYEKKNIQFQKKDIQMIFTSNHDENSWAGTEFERMGDAAPAFAALTYVLPGMPLIYNGQESGFNRRLAFFDKDSIDWIQTKLDQYSALYRNLNDLRKNNQALWSGEDGGDLVRVNNTMPDQVFSFKREKGDDCVVGVFNFTDTMVDVKLNDESLKGEYNTFGSDADIKLAANESIVLPPYGYAIFYRNK